MNSSCRIKSSIFKGLIGIENMNKRILDVMAIVVMGIAFIIMAIIAGQTTSDFRIIIQIVGFLMLSASIKPQEKYENLRKLVQIVGIAITVTGMMMQLSVYGL